MSTFNLFVYGTLRSHGGASDRLLGCTLIGDATMTGMLYDVEGRFPALLRYGADVVHGEVWRCPADLLPALDKYEGVEDGLFRRIGEEAVMSDGQRIACWVYTAGPALSRTLTAERRVASGRWPAAV